MLDYRQLQRERVKARIQEACLALDRIVHFVNCSNAFNEQRAFTRDTAGCVTGYCLRLKQWQRIRFLEKKLRAACHEA